MRALLLPAVVAVVSTALMAQVAPPKQTAKPNSASPTPAAQASPDSSSGLPTDDQKIIYALGLSISRSLSQLDLSPSELEIIERAMKDAVAGKPAIDLSTWGPKIQGFAGARAARVREREKTASDAYLAKAAAEPGAVKTDSGLIYREVKAGTGASPQPTDTVKINYRGTLANGTEFDSSYTRNEPAQFALNSVIPCWTEGVQKMKVGGKAVLVCPSTIAYGDRGHSSIPGGAALIFDIELLDVVPATPETPPAPGTPAAPANPANPDSPANPAPATAPAPPPTPPNP